MGAGGVSKPKAVVICLLELSLGELLMRTFKGATKSMVFKNQELWTHGNDSARQGGATPETLARAQLCKTRVGISGTC